MRECVYSIFLTLVVVSLLCFQPSFCLAAPNDSLNPNLVKEPIQDVNDPALFESALKNRKEDQIIQLTMGWLAGHVTKKLDDGNHTAIGLTYDWQDTDQNYWSVSGKWLNSEAAWLEVGKKFMFYPENLYEPYYKLSISHFMDPEDSLAGLTRIDSFKASASVGLLDIWTLGRILNIEMGTHWGIPGLAFHVQAGAQWSF